MVKNDLFSYREVLSSTSEQEFANDSSKGAGLVFSEGQKIKLRLSPPLKTSIPGQFYSKNSFIFWFILFCAITSFTCLKHASYDGKSLIQKDRSRFFLKLAIIMQPCNLL